jgi:hypothetical protein
MAFIPMLKELLTLSIFKGQVEVKVVLRILKIKFSYNMVIPFLCRYLKKEVKIQ